MQGAPIAAEAAGVFDIPCWACGQVRLCSTLYLPAPTSPTHSGISAQRITINNSFYTALGETQSWLFAVIKKPIVVTELIVKTALLGFVLNGIETKEVQRMSP